MNDSTGNAESYRCGWTQVVHVEPGRACAGKNHLAYAFLPNRRVTSPVFCIQAEAIMSPFACQRVARQHLLSLC